MNLRFRDLTGGDRFIAAGRLWTKLGPGTARRHSETSLAHSERGFGYLGDPVCGFEEDDAVEFVPPNVSPSRTDKPFGISPAPDRGVLAMGEPRCECHRCIFEQDLVDENSWPLSMTKMIVCRECGNKRCPKASDHRFACTGSNEPGQVGSIDHVSLEGDVLHRGTATVIDGSG